MCKDFLRMGYSNFIVDPAVRLAYHPGEARQLYTSKVTVKPISPAQLAQSFLNSACERDDGV